MEDLINREGLFPTFSFLARKTNVNRTKLIFDVEVFHFKWFLLGQLYKYIAHPALDF